MKTLKTILMLIALAVLIISIDTSCKLSELNGRLDEIRETWVLATTPAIEEIEAEDLTLQKHNYPENNYQEEVK